MSGAEPAAAQRRAELAANLRDVEERIAAACAAAGRRRGDVSWVAVSKTWPVSDVLAVVELGVRDLGESRDQEAAGKAVAVRDAFPESTVPESSVPESTVAWHFVGQLQSNKARSVASYAAVVQSLDRARLAYALSDGALVADRVLRVLLQVSLDGDASRGGCGPDRVGPLADLVAGLPGLALAGVMAVAPRGVDPRPAFDRLAGISDRLRVQHPEAREISAGMSGDLEAAVASGATLLRVGSAVFGPRAAPLR